MHSRLRSPLLVVMIQSSLLLFSCNEHTKLWVRKWIASFFPFFTLKEALLFKSLEHAWEVHLGGRMLSLVSPLCPLPGECRRAGPVQLSGVGFRVSSIPG